MSAITLDESSDEDDLVLSAQKKRKISSDNIRRQERSSPKTQRTFSRLQSGSLRSAEASPSHSDPLSPSDNLKPPLSRSSRRLRQRSQAQIVHSLSSESPHDAPSMSLSPLQQPSTRISDIASPETSDEDDIVMTSKPTTRRRRSYAVKDDPFVADDDKLQYISEDEIPARRIRRSHKKQGDDFIVDDDEVEYLSSGKEDDVQTHEPRKSRKSRKLSTNHKSPRTPHRLSRREQEELDEDLEDLRTSEQEEDTVQNRTRGGPVRTERDRTREHFEILRRRRAGERVPRIEDPDEEEDSEVGVHMDLIGRPFHGTPEDGGSIHSSADIGHESEIQEDFVEDEEDFVVDDETTGGLNRPNADIPLEFTSFASAKPRELFPHIIEWLVKNKLAPAFSRNDELFNLAFARIDDQVKAQAGSRLISSAWGTTFKRAILARPNMSVVALPGDDEDHVRTCDACSRVNNPARYEFVFSGNAYSKRTLEPIDNSDNEGEDDDHEDDNASLDEHGHALPSTSLRFYLGRFCAANAEMGHKLTHWKHHLNESLMSYLDEQGVLSADAIVAREKMNKKKREREAETIVDNMQEIGVIAELWAEFENNLKDARLGMEGYERKGGRSKGRVGAIRSTTENGKVREWSGDRYKVIQVDTDSEGE